MDGGIGFAGQCRPRGGRLQGYRLRTTGEDRRLPSRGWPTLSNDAYMPLHVGRAGAPRPMQGMAGDDGPEHLDGSGSWAAHWPLLAEAQCRPSFFGLMHYGQFLDFRFRHRGGAIGDVSEAAIRRFRLTPRRVHVALLALRPAACRPRSSTARPAARGVCSSGAPAAHASTTSHPRDRPEEDARPPRLRTRHGEQATASAAAT